MSVSAAANKNFYIRIRSSKNFTARSRRAAAALAIDGNDEIDDKIVVSLRTRDRVKDKLLLRYVAFRLQAFSMAMRVAQRDVHENVLL